ncbi:MAG: glutamate racemase [Acidobacteria bacterium]|nr:glutamate racemase [Acidobacteriota bacterium]
MDFPIGIFDSGIGGLTVYSAIRRRLPGNRILYLGDTARVPYGTKSTQTIIKYSIENTAFLLRRGVRLVVVACNTSSAVSLPSLQSQVPVPVVGVIRPGAASAVSRSRSRRIGVLGTEATIRSQAYLRALKELDPNVRVFMQACPLFVPLVEEGWLDHDVTRRVASIYLGGMRTHDIDTLVLGCTHYPLIKGAIADALELDGGGRVDVIDSADAAADQVADMATAVDGGAGLSEFFVTDSAARFRRVAELFLGKLRGTVTEVDVVHD